MIKARLLLTIVVFSACFTAFSVAAQSKEMYQYTDENGTVVFTDQRPAGQEVEAQAIPAGPPLQGNDPNAGAAAAVTQPGSSVAEQRREEIAEHKQEARAKKARNEAQCAAWQSEVDRLEPNRRVFITNEQGETERMDDVERVNQVAALKQKIAANCR
ncbi:MAG: DUF4124 domain-containing protein [Xanthomonadales bacterium]|jgi:hypothetical protein|nr:DUF4124 domain-containing protein [Xanthomonadales bacterium]